MQMKRIMDSDSNIRHCIVSDTEGEIKAVMHRDGIRNYLSDEETICITKKSSKFMEGTKATIIKTLVQDNMLLQHLKN